MDQLGSYGSNNEMLTLSQLLTCNICSFDPVSLNCLAWLTLVELITAFLISLKENQCTFTGKMEIILLL